MLDVTIYESCYWIFVCVCVCLSFYDKSTVHGQSVKYLLLYTLQIDKQDMSATPGYL